ncbi:MAG: hypothetical protein M3550_06070 [Actinomycetota bacterium]|jgi:hypothetical protein|nr:hypothetical protein [Actinomycetota bacterium]
MRLLNRKSQLQRLLETVNDSLDVPSGIKFGLPAVGTGNALKAGLPKGKALKAGLIAGGLAGLTAGSAGISSLRRRQEGARDDS